MSGTQAEVQTLSAVCDYSAIPALFIEKTVAFIEWSWSNLFLAQT